MMRQFLYVFMVVNCLIMFNVLINFWWQESETTNFPLNPFFSLLYVEQNVASILGGSRLYWVSLNLRNTALI